MNLIQLLQGKKTYLTGTALMVLVFGVWQGWWKVPAEAYAALSALALMFLRAGVRRELGALGEIAAMGAPAAPPDAGAVALAEASRTSQTGQTSRTGPTDGPGAAGKTIMGVLLGAVVLGLLFCVACASFNATVFNAEKMIGDAGKGAVHEWNVYYRSATNGADAATLERLNAQRDQVYDASRKLGSSLAVVEELRQEYSTNQTATVQQSLQMALEVAQDQTTNLVVLIKAAVGVGRVGPVGQVGQ